MGTPNGTEGTTASPMYGEGNINRKILSVISFNLFNNAVRAPEEMGKGLFQGPIARTRICSGSA